MFGIRDFLCGRLALRLADFSHPFDVLAAEDLTPAEKQEILAAWACDAHAPESGTLTRESLAQAELDARAAADALIAG